MAKKETSDDAPQRQHRATYARDKRKGGYLIRVEGPFANRFTGRVIPVTRRDNTENPEKLSAVIWTGVDEETKQPVALYSFEQQPRDEEDNITF